MWGGWGVGGRWNMRVEGVGDGGNQMRHEAF